MVFCANLYWQTVVSLCHEVLVWYFSVLPFSLSFRSSVVWLSMYLFMCVFPFLVCVPRNTIVHNLVSSIPQGTGCSNYFERVGSCSNHSRHIDLNLTRTGISKAVPVQNCYPRLCAFVWIYIDLHQRPTVARTTFFVNQRSIKGSKKHFPAWCL